MAIKKRVLFWLVSLGLGADLALISLERGRERRRVVVFLCIILKCVLCLFVCFLLLLGSKTQCILLTRTKSVFISFLMSQLTFGLRVRLWWWKSATISGSSCPCRCCHSLSVCICTILNVTALLVPREYQQHPVTRLLLNEEVQNAPCRHGRKLSTLLLFEHSTSPRMFNGASVEEAVSMCSESSLIFFYCDFRVYC